MLSNVRKSLPGGEASVTGNGKILAVFRTIPAPAREIVEEKMALNFLFNYSSIIATGLTQAALALRIFIGKQ